MAIISISAIKKYNDMETGPKFKVGDSLKQALAGNSPHTIGEVIVISKVSGKDYDTNRGYFSEDYLVKNYTLVKSQKDMKVNFLLRYDLKADPIEEFETMKEVKARIRELVKDKDRNGLKLDSIRVYEVKSATKVVVETSVVIKGI